MWSCQIPVQECTGWTLWQKLKYCSDSLFHRFCEATAESADHTSDSSSLGVFFSFLNKFSRTVEKS